MSIQDEAFDIQRVLHNSKAKDHDYTYKAWEHFRDWAYELEQDNKQLRFAFQAYKTVIKCHKLCICGKSLPKGNNTFCKKCSKLPKDAYGLPIRKR